MKKWLIAAAVAVASLAGSEARAQTGCHDCGHGHGHSLGHGLFSKFHGGGGSISPTYGHLAGLHHAGFGYGAGNTHRAKLPVYMAAPWYLYWPYDGHFQTVAPMAYGAFYPPPAYTGNPFNPGAYHGYVPGAPLPQYPVSPVGPPVGPTGKP
jgi:hypothetical protein